MAPRAILELGLWRPSWGVDESGSRILGAAELKIMWEWESLEWNFNINV